MSSPNHHSSFTPSMMQSRMLHDMSMQLNQGSGPSDSQLAAIRSQHQTPVHIQHSPAFIEQRANLATNRAQEEILRANEAKAWVELLAQLDDIETPPSSGRLEMSHTIRGRGGNANSAHPWYNENQMHALQASQTPLRSFPEDIILGHTTPRSRLTPRQTQSSRPTTFDVPIVPPEHNHAMGMTALERNSVMPGPLPDLSGSTNGDASELLRSLYEQTSPQLGLVQSSLGPAPSSMNVPQHIEASRQIPQAKLESIMAMNRQKAEIDQMALSLSLQDLSTWPEFSPALYQGSPLQSGMMGQVKPSQDFSMTNSQVPINVPNFETGLGFRLQPHEHRISLPPTTNFVNFGNRGSWIESETSSGSTRGLSDITTPSAWSMSSGAPTPSSMYFALEPGHGWNTTSPSMIAAPVNAGQWIPCTQPQEHLFVNYTPADAAAINSGVAPSGSSRRRRDERARKRMTLHMMQSTANSVRSPNDPNHLRAATLQRVNSKDERRLSAPAFSRQPRPESIALREDGRGHTRVQSTPNPSIGPDGDLAALQTNSTVGSSNSITLNGQEATIAPNLVLGEVNAHHTQLNMARQLSTDVPMSRSDSGYTMINERSKRTTKPMVFDIADGMYF